MSHRGVEQSTDVGEYWVSYRDPEMHECPRTQCQHDRVFNVLCWLVFILTLPMVAAVFAALYFAFQGA